jgi:hypothetical protein
LLVECTECLSYDELFAVSRRSQDSGEKEGERGERKEEQENGTRRKGRIEGGGLEAGRIGERKGHEEE